MKEIQLLERHFDTALETPDGIKRLRELILSLAMKGKLVPQNPNDQPVSELLKEIEKEKAKLVKEGKIKKQEPLPPIKPEEIPYELPIGWVWCRIREICHDWGQKTPDKKFTYIDVGTIDNINGLVNSDVQILESHDAPSRARKIVKNGTVIYSTVRPYLLNIAIIDKDYDPEPIASTAFAILHPYDNVYNKYINYYLRSRAFIDYVEFQMKGVAYPAINDGNFFAGLFPIAPLPEQKRIVEKIDQLMSLCDKLEAERNARDNKRISIHTAAVNRLLSASDSSNFNSSWNFITKNFNELYSVIENVTELKKAILQLAVMGKLVPQDRNDQSASELLMEIEKEKARLVKKGKIKKQEALPAIKPEEIPYHVPEGWVWCRFFNVNVVKTELVKPEDYLDEQQVAPDSIEKGSGVILFERTVRESGVTGPNNRFYKGQILYSKIRPSLSKAVIAPYNGLCSADMYPIVTFIYPQFMLKVILSEMFLEQVRVAENRIKMPKLNLESLGKFVIPLPPLAEQKRIVAKIDQLMELCNSLERGIKDSTEKRSRLLGAVLARV